MSEELSKEEKRIVALKKETDEAFEAAEEISSELRKAVHDYLESGGSPTKLGKAFDPPVTRGRIYQIRSAWISELRRDRD